MDHRKWLLGCCRTARLSPGEVSVLAHKPRQWMDFHLSIGRKAPEDDEILAVYRAMTHSGFQVPYPFGRTK
jgi:hypothetical protein